MLSLSRFALLFVVWGAGALVAQDLPQVTTPVATLPISPNGTPLTIDLSEHFQLPSVTNNIVQFDTVLGRFNVELKTAPADQGGAPLHVANFLSYVREGAYTNSFFHRTARFSSETEAAITQGGGFKLPYSTVVVTHSPLALEGSLPNKRGSLAAARLGSPTNSATSQFFFNVQNNSAVSPGTGFPILPAGNSTSGYSVFGQVIGTGMTIVDAIAAVPVYNAVDGSANTSAFSELPLRNKVGNILTDQNLITINSITEIPIYPPASGTGPSVLTFSVQISDPTLAQVSISGSILTITPRSKTGSANVTVEAKDTNGNVATSTFSITTEVAIVRSPQSQTVLIGDVVVFQVAATGSPLTYQWKFNGADITGANDPILLLPSVIPGSAGSFSVAVTNGNVTVNSFAATLTVSEGVAKGRLSNLSVRSIAGLSSQTFIAGFAFAGSTESGVVIRGIGPTLSHYGVTGSLEDPRLELYSGATLINTNDDWAGSDGRAVGAFVLPTGSKDAVLNVQLPAAGYTAQVKGAGTTTGEALLEVYESLPVSPTTELINLSARAQVSAAQPFIAGFNIAAGTNRTVLIRAVGPGLTRLGVPGVLQDPKIVLYNAGGTKIDENEDWGGSQTLVDTMARVGAFDFIDPASKDSALLVTLPAGLYSVNASGPVGASGVVLLEVYLVR